jgi:hypothetical protein
LRERHVRGKNYLQLGSLYGHWVTADSIRVRVFLDLPDATSAGFPADVADVAQAFSKARALTVFYGMLYVVVEGTQN